MLCLGSHFENGRIAPLMVTYHYVKFYGLIVFASFLIIIIIILLFLSFFLSVDHELVHELINTAN
jgi:uncharacterized membrane protein